jgi:hypothetical protein
MQLTVFPKNRLQQKKERLAMLHKLDISFLRTIQNNQKKCRLYTDNNNHSKIKRSYSHPEKSGPSNSSHAQLHAHDLKGVNPWHLFKHARKGESVQACTKIQLVCAIIISGHCTPSAANVARARHAQQKYGTDVMSCLLALM